MYRVIKRAKRPFGTGIKFCKTNSLIHRFCFRGEASLTKHHASTCNDLFRVHLTPTILNGKEVFLMV